MGIRKLKLEKNELEKKVGSDLTLEEYCNYLHDQADGFVTIATKSDKKHWKEKSYPIQQWQENIIVRKNVGCFASVNTFFIPKRSNSNVRVLQYLFVDLDTRNVGISKENAIEQIEFQVKNERLPKPSTIVDSGGGLNILWKIESVPGRFSSVLKLYGLVEKFLIETLSEQGADFNAQDPARMLRIPGTINEKYDREVKVISVNDSIYTLRFFQDFMNEINGVDLQKEKKKTIPKERTGKIARLFNFYTLAIARTQDLKKLCELRNYKIEGHRNAVLHIYAYNMMLIHQNYYIALDRTKELNDSLAEPLGDADINSICKTVFERYKEHKKDKEKGYNYRTSTIIDKLNITEKEMQHMKTLIDKKEKNERDKRTKKSKRRNTEGLTDREKKKNQLIRQVKELHEKGLKQREIAEKLGIHKSNVSRYLAE